MAASAIGRLTIHRLSVPLRQKVTHAASARRVSDPVVVSVELNGGSVGYGETLARPYVTGETTDSVVQTIAEVFSPLLLDFHPERFPDALEAIDALPFEDPDGSPIPAARAAV
ncbi:MAG: muconate cycloisomerase, partial [Phycisphaerae bacterium]